MKANGFGLCFSQTASKYSDTERGQTAVWELHNFKKSKRNSVDVLLTGSKKTDIN